MAIALVVAAAACGGPPPLPPLPPNSFAFAVVGDAPYYPIEQGRFGRVLDDVERGDVAWLLHVGDFLWYPCSDEAYEERRRQLAALPRPVVYTPGDNEWADCWQEKPGRYPPLGRLASLRRIFFPAPGRSLGGRPMAVESQAADPAFAEFVENARWERGGFVFATLHVVGSGNAGAPFPGRGAADDAEAARRAEAAVAWLDRTFDVARARSAKGVVLALHANVGLERADSGRARRGYERLVARLEERVAVFPGSVLLVHGDSHVQRVDHPLADSAGRPYANFTRLETFGSPDVGWVRVTVDTVAGRIVRYEPRLVRGWW